ncbi:MAG: YchJ family protein [Acidimicrobiia bacterium]
MSDPGGPSDRSGPSGPPCPCGTGAALASCCGRYLDGQRHAPTAEALMRARYSAHALGDVEFLRRSWHPDTRPSTVTDPGVTWVRLDVRGRERGGQLDARGTVDFVAHYRSGEGPGVLAERSRFERVGTRWLYVDGEPLDA